MRDTEIDWLGALFKFTACMCGFFLVLAVLFRSNLVMDVLDAYPHDIECAAATAYYLGQLHYAANDGVKAHQYFRWIMDTQSGTSYGERAWYFDIETLRLSKGMTYGQMSDETQRFLDAHPDSEYASQIKHIHTDSEGLRAVVISTVSWALQFRDKDGKPLSERTQDLESPGN